MSPFTMKPTKTSLYYFIAGCITGGICIGFLPILGNTVTGAILAEPIAAESNNKILTLQAEIARLRRALQNNQIPDEVVAKQTVQTCNNHSDCTDQTAICQDQLCTPITNPLCRCNTGTTGDYIMCISDNGLGSIARTISCGEETCNNSPVPHCNTK